MFCINSCKLRSVGHIVSIDRLILKQPHVALVCLLTAIFKSCLVLAWVAMLRISLRTQKKVTDSTKSLVNVETKNN